MKIAIAIIIAIILIGGGYFLFAQKSMAPVTPETPQATTEVETSTNAPAATAQTVTVTYDGTSFSPSSITIKKGDTVMWVNQSSDPMWVASAVHPSHQTYSGTTLSQHCPDTSNDSFDQCSVSATYSFTFTKVGSWAYHNHTKASAQGTVVVTD